MFVYYTEEDTYSFSYHIEPGDSAKFLGANIISIITEENTIKFYLNSELLGSMSVSTTDRMNVSSGFSIANYTNNIDINEANLNFTDLLYFDKAIQENEFINLQRLFHINS